MKYYDTYLPYIIDDDYDRSYPSPEVQLLWRLDDLQDRLEEMIEKDFPYQSSNYYSDNDIRYASMTLLYDIYMVERAIELAKDDLVNKYGLPDLDMLNSDELELVTEVDCDGHMSLLEHISEELPKAA